jgi:hypothetical protein
MVSQMKQKRSGLHMADIAIDACDGLIVSMLGTTNWVRIVIFPDRAHPAGQCDNTFEIVISCCVCTDDCYASPVQFDSIQFQSNSVTFHYIPFHPTQFNSLQFKLNQCNSIQFNSMQFNSMPLHSIHFHATQSAQMQTPRNPNPSQSHPKARQVWSSQSNPILRKPIRFM